jgi:DNA-binding HxlR family transcriptional regulator
MSQRYIDVSAELDQACPVVEILDDVGGKWSISVLVVATRGPVRFTELERAIPGISRRMLTLTLRKLERDGLLIRTIYATVPPKVEYALTDAARELQASLTALTEWAARHRATIIAARNAYDRNAGRMAG